jgi:hypothetical protein
VGDRLQRARGSRRPLPRRRPGARTRRDRQGHLRRRAAPRSQAAGRGAGDRRGRARRPATRPRLALPRRRSPRWPPRRGRALR